MKKNAFTLVELLAVIIILGVLATMITPNLMNLFEEKQNTLYNNTIEEVKNVARLYASDNPGMYSRIDDEGFTYIYIKTLCEEKYISCPINNPKDNSNIEGAVKITYENDKYVYKYVENAPYEFETDSWSTIISAVKEGVYPYDVGDIKTIDLGNLGTHTLRISNTTPCSSVSVESETACGFVLEFADIITTHNMNSNYTNVGGWPASSMYSYLNTEETGIYNSLPTELKNAIIGTKVISSHGSADSSNFTTEGVKLYLLSGEEIYEGYSASYDSSKGTSRQLDYYKAQGVSTSNYSGAIKKLNGTANYWWLRSATSINDNSFYSVHNYGSWNSYTVNFSSGVSPAFRLDM